jgi:hypothetical protein
MSNSQKAVAGQTEQACRADREEIQADIHLLDEPWKDVQACKPRT